MHTKNRTLKIIIGVIIATLAVYLISYGIRLGNYKKAIANITINPVDLSTISDGSYIGTYDVDFISVKVEVTVADHTITQIKLLEHHNEKGKPAEAIIDTILQKQSLDVDAVAGASNSSKVIKKAIENALTSQKS